VASKSEHDIAVRIQADVQNFNKQLGTVERDIKRTVGNIDKMATRFIVAGTAVVGSMALATQGAAVYAEEVDRMSRLTGMATETISGLGYAADTNQASMQQLADGLKYLARNMDAAVSGSKQQQEAFDRLGVKYDDGAGRARNMEAVLYDVADGLKNNTNEAERTALAMDIFGRSGEQLIPLLSQGSTEIRKMQQEARQFGVVLDTEATKSLVEYKGATERLTASVQGLKVAVGKDLAPALQSQVQMITDLVAGYQKIPEPLRENITQTTLYGAELVLLSAGLAKAAIAAEWLFKAIKAHPYALIAAGIITAASAAYQYAKQQERLRDELGPVKALEMDIKTVESELATLRSQRAQIESTNTGEAIELNTQYRDTQQQIIDKERELQGLVAARGKVVGLSSADKEGMKALYESYILKRQGLIGDTGTGSGSGSGKVITELDVLDYRLKRAESQSRLYGDAAEFVAQRQALMQQQLAIANEAVAQAERAYERAAATTGLYSEAAMQAGEALDQWREKQDALTKSIEATRKAMDPVAKAVETVERGGGSNKSLKGLLRAGVSNYDEQVAVLSQASGFDLSTARAMLDSTLLERFKTSGNIPAASRSVAVTVNNNGRDLTGDDVVKAIGRAEVIR
jgi:TP901 family phage tail tape measure protein